MGFFRAKYHHFCGANGTKTPNQVKLPHFLWGSPTNKQKQHKKMKKPRFLNIKIITREYKHSKSVTVRVSLPDKTSFDISSGITCQYPPVNLEFPVTEQMHAAKSQALARFYSLFFWLSSSVYSSWKRLGRL